MLPHVFAQTVQVVQRIAQPLLKAASAMLRVYMAFCTFRLNLLLARLHLEDLCGASHRNA